MNHPLFTSNQTPIYLDAQPLGQGGEGNVYEVLIENQWSSLVAKIYHSQELEKEQRNKLEGLPTREAKIKYLVNYQSYLPSDAPVMFPEELLYNEQGQFVGFLMRKAMGEIDLSSLSTLNISPNLSLTWHQLYDRTHVLGIARRAKLCQKIAEVFEQVHQGGEFVLVDIKPENIRVGLNGEVALIDMDSMQIIHNDAVRFPAEKLTPEYCPPEYQRLNFKKDLIPQSWDHFALGIIFYKVLLGLHPYTGSCLPPYEGLTTNAQKIAQGLFPNGAQKDKFSIIPHPHDGFKAMPTDLQQLFLRCFEQGHQQPEVRPNATEWKNAFAQIPEENYLDLIPQIPSVQVASIGNGAGYQIDSYTQAMATQQAAPPKKESRVALFGFLAAAMLILTYLGALFNNIAGVDPVAEADFAYYKQHVPGDFEWAGNVVEGRRLVLNYSKYGYLNSKGEIVVPLQFENAGDFKEGYAWVKQKGKYGFINIDGKMVITPQFDGAGFFFKGLAQVLIKTKRGTKVFLIDRDGKAVTNRYDYIGDFFKGRAIVRDGKNLGYINRSGQEVIDLKYDTAQNFDENGEALVGFEEKKYYINRNGQYTRDFTKIVNQNEPHTDY
ncbi:hypothetical protein BKI52_17530 [marine bacterium AO1-C]|nr:hypothetical protein BKI52_17530 [marine bacterium AO1-C]